MRSARVFPVLIVVAILLGCAQKDEVSNTLKQTYPEAITLTVKNPVAMERQGVKRARRDAAIVVEMMQLKAKAPEFNSNAFVILVEGRELASQAIDRDNDGNTDHIVCVAEFAPNETKTLTIRYASEVHP